MRGGVAYGEGTTITTMRHNLEGISPVSAGSARGGGGHTTPPGLHQANMWWETAYGHAPKI